MSPLRTRKPTGQVAYPLVLVEGIEKTGKTYAALALSKSERIGRAFVLELGELTADEYKAVGDYEIVEHNGTYSDIFEQLVEVTKVPMEDGKPNLLVIDSGSALWGLLKDWADARARRSKRGRETLARDPDAEVDITMNLWTDAKERWYDVLNLLRAWPGVAVMVARGSEVAKVANGQPVAGQTEWTIEAQKSTRFEVTAVVRMSKPHTATLVDARSLHVDVPARGIALPEANPLEHLVFDVLAAGGEFEVGNMVRPQVGRTAAIAKTELIEKFKHAVPGKETATAEATAVWKASKLGDTKEVSDDQWGALCGLVADRLVELSNAKEEAKEKAKSK